MRVPHSTSPIIPPPQATYRSFAEKLALKPSPTLLYQAPSHTLYVVGSYAFGLFCLSYAGFNFYAHYLHPPPGLSPWIPVAFGGVCFAMTSQEFERTHLLSAPFRHASYALWRLLQTLGRVWTRDGFVKVFVRSSEGGRVRTLKLDVSGGWALDGGRGIERLVKVKAM
ncbi:MAG: hypothetical protein M1832_002219 [Thelocarpon impressellum]|nr:MAG: hypothetical protein M1832_002219 [Thelocarpon impressellum]